MHDRYNNFRAYYNAYYNAEKKLAEGEEALEARNQTIDRGRLIELFPTGTGTSQTATFQETVDKSAELLRDRPGSKWADDALLLIGKAYFYQGNVVGAEQKFRETAAAAEVRNQPRLADEARFWLGRTYAITERYDDGVAVLQEALSRSDIDARWQARMRLALGELYARAERWDEAAEALRSGIDAARDNELEARAYFLLGQVEEANGNWGGATESYALAADRAPEYSLEYAARLSRALVLGLDAEQHEEALQAIRAMRRDDKNFQQRAEVELAWARIEAASGNVTEARRRYQSVLYDETLAGTAVRGEAHFRLGEFYRDVEKHFVRAAAHFDTAATALPSADAAIRYSRAALRDVDQQAATFRSVAATSQRMFEIDSLVALASLSEDDFAARIAEIEAERLRVFQEQQRRTEQLRANQAFAGGAPRTRGDSDALVPESATVTTEEDGRVVTRNLAGFLSYRDPNSVQAGLIAFEQVWGDRPLVPNWRRRAAIEASAVTSTTGTGGDVTQRTATPAGIGPPPLDLSAVPRTPAKRQALTVELAELRYELANALFLSLGRADSAVALYRRILDETPDAPVAPRARYALAEVMHADGRLEEAEPLFRELIDADSASALAVAARARLGVPPPEVETPRPEVSDASEDALIRLRARWERGDPLGAAEAFVALAEKDLEAPVAPRAYFAGMAAYLDAVRSDSLGLASPLPDSLRPARLLAAVAVVSTDGLPIEAEAAPPAPTPEPVDAPDALPSEPVETDVSARMEEVGEVDRDQVDDVLQRPRPLDDSVTPIDDNELRPRRTPQPVQPAPVELSDEGAMPVRSPLSVDSLATPDDVSGASETETALADSSAEALAALRDSSSASALQSDSLAVPVDSLGEAPGEAPGEAGAVRLSQPAITVADVMEALSQRYPGTPEAQRAQTLLAIDSGSGPLPSGVTSVSPGERDAPTAAQASGAPTPAAEIDPDASPYGTRGAVPIRSEVGGFSRRTNALADVEEARTLARQLIGEGFRAAVASDGQDVFVIVGQYPTDKALAVATGELPAVTLGAGTGMAAIADLELIPLGGEDG